MKSKSRFDIRVIYPDSSEKKFSDEFLKAEDLRILRLIEDYEKKQHEKIILGKVQRP